MNSLYDPDYTGTGHQPYQYDQIRTMYQYYLITHCDWEITFTDPSIDGLIVGVNIIINAEGTVVAKDYATIAERSHCRLAPLNDTGRQVITMRGRSDMAQLYGLTSVQYATNLSSYAAGTGSNPYNAPNIQVFLIDPSASATQRTVAYLAKLTYHGKLYSYMPPAQS